MIDEQFVRATIARMIADRRRVIADLEADHARIGYAQSERAAWNQHSIFTLLSVLHELGLDGCPKSEEK